MIRLFTDSDTDLTPSEALKYGYTIISMPYIIDDKIYYPYKDSTDFNFKEYYDLLRSGIIPKTSALNTYEYLCYFEPVFAAGDDILYVHFASKMSATFNNMYAALDILKEKYPDRKFYSVDTLGITVMSYCSVIEIGKMYKKGCSIDEILEWSKNEILHYATYFYADDLIFFKRSGRVSGLAAVFGNMLGFKPIIYMNEEGMMESIGKERGRKNAIKRLVNTVLELGDDLSNHKLYIAHSDNMRLAYELKETLFNELGDVDIDIVEVNPVCGAHCGPDCIGICFHSIHR